MAERTLTLSVAISEWERHLRARRFSARSVDDYVKCMAVVEKALGHDADPSTVTVMDAERIIASDRMANLSNTTIAKHVSCWRSFTEWGRKRHGWYDWARDLDRPRKDAPEYRRLTTPEVAAMLRANIDERRSTMVWIFAYTGIRLGEARRLRWGHVDLDEGTLIVELGKGGKGRTIPIAPTLADRLRVVRAWRANLYGDEAVAKDAFVHYFEHDRVVPDQGHAVTRDFFRGTSDRTLWRATKEAARVGGVRDPEAISTHMFRRHLLEFGSDQNVNMNTLRELAGHADIQTTSLYTGKAKLETMRTALAGIDFVTRPGADFVTPERTVHSSGEVEAAGVEPASSPLRGNSTAGVEPSDEEEAGW